MAILEVRNVVKRFGDYKASNDISLDVQEGSIYGLLGPNGAGKTTLIRMITNIYKPDEGEIRLQGKVVGPEMQERIGYLPEERGLYKKIKVIDQLVYFGSLKGMSSTKARYAAMEWLAKLNAADFAQKKVQELSKGMAQKVQFIATILHNPPFLILDEPFSGFDPVNAELLKQTVLDLRKAGTTIILSTHVMQQVEEMCDEITLINKGRAILQGSVRNIKKQHGRDRLILEFEGDSSFLDKYSDLEFINRSSSRAEIRVKGDGELAQEILKSALDSCTLYRYELVEPHLNQIFIDTVSNKEDYVITQEGGVA